MTTMTTPRPSPSPVPIVLVLAVWLAAALVAAAAGVLHTAPAPVIPAVVGLSNVALFVWFRRSESFRTVALTVPLRALVLFHAIRAGFGAFFLLQEARGILPSDFAHLAGVGDIFSGVGALVVAFAPLSAITRRRATFVWNLFALIDIVAVVIAAQRSLLFGDGRLRIAFAQFPNTVLPFFIVPLVFATHFLIAHRLRLEAKMSASSSGE